MAVTAAAIAEKDKIEQKVKGIGPYIKAHWKELLALVLAAIPALFIVFHKGAQQAAMQAAQPILDAVPGGAGSPGTPGGSGAPAGPSGGGDPGTSIPPPVVAAAQAAGVAPSSTLGISVNGSNPIVGNIAPKSQVAPPAAASPASSSSIVGRLGANAPGFRDATTPPAEPAPVNRLTTGLVSSLLARITTPAPAPAPAPATKISGLGTTLRRAVVPPPAYAPGLSAPALNQSNPVSDYGRGN